MNRTLSTPIYNMIKVVFSVVLCKFVQTFISKNVLNLRECCTHNPSFEQFKIQKVNQHKIQNPWGRLRSIYRHVMFLTLRRCIFLATR